VGHIKRQWCKLATYCYISSSTARQRQSDDHVGISWLVDTDHATSVNRACQFVVEDHFAAWFLDKKQRCTTPSNHLHAASIMQNFNSNCTSTVRPATQPRYHTRLNLIPVFGYPVSLSYSSMQTKKPKLL